MTPERLDRSNAGEPAAAGDDRRTAPPGRQRWEFVRAFVENSWMRPSAERAVARPHIVLLVVTLSAAVALGAGVVMQLLRPVPLPKASAPEAAPNPTGTGFSAVAGWDCAATATSGFEAVGRDAGWLTIAEGGWGQDGCHGTFEVMPMSGTADDELSKSAVWWFSPGAAGRCTVEVYVPRADPAKFRAAPAAHYQVRAGRGGQTLAEFVLDQRARPGSWVTVGTYPLSRTGISLLMTNRGEPPSPDTMLAITQVKVDCT